MQVTIESEPGAGYRQAIHVRNHTVFADVTAEKGGADTAPSPHELLLAALGACTSMTIQMYAAKKGWDLQGVTVSVSEEQVPAPNGAATQTIPQITKDIQVRGALDADQLERLQEIAERCPVNRLLSGHKQITGVLRQVA